MVIQIDKEIINYEDYLKRPPDQNSIKEVLRILKDFGIKINKQNVPPKNSNYSLLQWQKTTILNNLKTKGDF